MKKDPKQFRLSPETIEKLGTARFLMYQRLRASKSKPNHEPEWDAVLSTLAAFYIAHMEPAVYGTADEPPDAGQRQRRTEGE